MLEIDERYLVTNVIVALLALYCYVQFYRKKYNCLLYIAITMTIYVAAFNYFGEAIMPYSGVLLVFMGAVAIILGNKDWKYFQENDIRAMDLFFADRVDKVLSSIVFIGIPLSIIFM